MVQVISAMKTVGFEKEIIDAIFRIVGGILQLGNIDFVTEGDHSAVSDNGGHLFS